MPSFENLPKTPAADWMDDNPGKRFNLRDAGMSKGNLPPLTKKELDDIVNIGAPTKVMEYPSTPAGNRLSPLEKHTRRIHFGTESGMSPQRETELRGEALVAEPTVEASPAITEQPTAEKPGSEKDFATWLNEMPEWVREGKTTSEMLDIYNGQSSFTRQQMESRQPGFTHAGTGERVSLGDAAEKIHNASPNHEANLQEEVLKQIGEELVADVESWLESQPALTREHRTTPAGEVQVETGELEPGIDLRLVMGDGRLIDAEVIISEGDAAQKIDVVYPPDEQEPVVMVDAEPITEEQLPVVKEVIAEVTRATHSEVAVAEVEQPIEAPVEPIAAKEQPPAPAATEKPAAERQRDIELKAKGNALRYVMEVAKQSPQMKQFMETVVQDMAQQRGVEVQEMMRTINDKNMPPSAEALAAIKALSAAQTSPNSSIWNEHPSNDSMLGKTATEYRRAIEAVLRGMV